MDETTKAPEPDEQNVEEPPDEWCCQDGDKAGWGDGEKVK